MASQVASSTVGDSNTTTTTATATATGAASAGSGSGNGGIQKRGNVATLTTGGSSTSFSSSNDSAIDTYGDEFKAPDYTIKDILKAIPSHCYERKLAVLFYYVFRDIVCILTLGYSASALIPHLPYNWLRFAGWAGYIYCQSLFMTGIWVLAHECGHQAFSSYGWVNDTVGFFLHSYLMVPYFSWKHSHSKHHKATGHMTRDMVFVPLTKDEFLDRRHARHVDDIVGDSPLYTLYVLFLQLTVGWIMYLWTNASGQRYPDKNFWEKSHFNPSSVIAEPKDYWYVLISDIGILGQSLVLYGWYKQFGGFNLVVHWFLPYLLVNHWLVFITYLQHSDPKMPHYEAEQWNFARGAAATVDREFGFVGKYLFHDIIETHVLHHYCSRIPFYNAREASEAIKKVMGHHYQHRDENMWVSLWKSGRWCQYVDGTNGILMFRNVNGKGVGTKI